MTPPEINKIEHIPCIGIWMHISQVITASAFKDMLEQENKAFIHQVLKKEC